MVGAAANLVDPGPAVVEQLCRRLAIVDPAPLASPVRLFTSGPRERLQRQAYALIGVDATVEPLPQPA